MIRKLYVTIWCLIASVSFSFSQAILTFEFSTLVGDEVSATSNFNNANLTGSSITRGAGLTASANTDRFNATSWALTSIPTAVTGNDYMQFTITPNVGFQFSVSSIAINLQRSLTGPSAVALRSSADGYTADLGGIQTIVDNGLTQTFTFTFTLTNSTVPVTYRIYKYAEATGGSGGIGDGAGNDIIVNGTVTSTSSTTITTGAVATSPFSVTCVAGAAGTVDFTSTNTFNPGNIYTAQLSNPVGSFTSPTNIGTLSSTANSGTISITIPAATLSGAGYRIRVVSDNPSTTGTNSAAFTINSTCPSSDLEPGDLAFVGFDTYVLSGTDKLVIANLVNINPGTNFTLANTLYEVKDAANVSSGRWYNGNNNSPCGDSTFTAGVPFTTVSYNGPGVLSAGSVICVSLSGSGAGSSITSISLNGTPSGLFTYDSNPYVQFSSSEPDAIFLMQGTFSAPTTDGMGDVSRTFNGDVLGGIQTRGSFQPLTVAGNNGGCRISRIHPQIQCLGISTAGASSAYYGYYNPGALHIGSQKDLLSNIINLSANWTMATTAAVDGDDVPTCNTPFTVTSFSVPGQWTGASDNNWFYCGNWENFSVPNDSTDVLIPATATNIAKISYLAAYSDFYADTANCRNIVIDAKELNLEGSAQNVLVVNGNLTMNATANTKIDVNDGNNATADGEIYLLGNWLNNKGEPDFEQGNGSVLAFGSNIQTITITGAGPEVFYNFVINKSGGNLTLNDHVEIGGSSTDLIANRLGLLTLTSRNIITGTSYLYVTNPSIGAISGGSAVSFVDGNLRRHTNSINLYNFPTGAGTYYMRSAVRATDILENVIEVDAQNTGYGTYVPLEITINNVSTNRWWDVSKISGITPVSVRLYWNTLAGDGITNAADLVVAHWSNRDHVGALSVLEWWNRGRSAVNSSGTIANGWVESSETMVTYSPFTFGSITVVNPLPVELFSFEMNCLNHSIQAKWTTTSEVNNDYFEIQGSMDAINYHSIVREYGAGNSNTLQNYEVIIANPGSSKYFQLLQVDFNGAEKFYPPLYLQCELENNPMSALFWGNQIQLILPDGISTQFDIVLSDLNGKMINFQMQGIKADNQPILLSLPYHLAAGIYIISLKDHITCQLYHVKVFKN